MARVSVWAVADLHAAVPANRARVDELQPEYPDDWLIVAGDVAEKIDAVIEVLSSLCERFATVVWAPGNHELFSSSADPFKGKERYNELVRRCREIGVLTPEDSYPIFNGVTICPLFTLYDYSFRPPNTTMQEALGWAHDSGVVMTDEYAIKPYVDIRAWCWDRLSYSVRRLARVSGPTVLINHWPLVVEPTYNLQLPQISLWCGTRHTRSWPVRYQARAVIYGHLHIPSEITVDGVPHVEVSLGYPREWEASQVTRPWPYRVLSMEVD